MNMKITMHTTLMDRSQEVRKNSLTLSFRLLLQILVSCQVKWQLQNSKLSSLKFNRWKVLLKLTIFLKYRGLPSFF